MEDQTTNKRTTRFTRNKTEDISNMLYGKIPPATLPSGSEIVINPYQPGAACVLNSSQTIAKGAKITIAENKKIKIPLNLVIQ